jgi:hypothetical protein
MSLVTAATVRSSAEVWAKAQGYESAALIPAAARDGAIDALAKTTGASTAEVRAALVDVWSATNNARGQKLDAFGASPSYQGASVQRSIATSPLATRFARAPVPEPARKVTDDATRLVSQRLRKEVAGAFGEAGAALFDVPSTLFRAWEAHVPGADRNKPTLSSNAIKDVGAWLHAVATAPSTSLATRNVMLAHRAQLESLLGDVVKHGATDRRLARVNELLLPMLESAAKDAGIFMKPVVKAARDGGNAGFAVFRAMRPVERELERLRTVDPDAYAVTMKRKQAFADFERGVAEACAHENLEPRKAKILGALVTIGTDRRTGEETVFSPQHGALPMERFLAARHADIDARKRLAKIENDIPLHKLDKAPVGIALEGEVRWASLTDDAAKDDAVTRIYAVRAHVDAESGVARDVVVEGRFAGHYLDTLVNEAGRLVEGTAHRYNPVTLRASKVPERPDVADREPYVTVARVSERGVAKEKLFLQLPNGRDDWTEVRQAIRKLSSQIPSIEYIAGSRNASFTFEAKDFNVVREALGGLALSTGALDHVRGWFQELAEAERATAAENLGVYSPEAIGGFKAQVRTLSGKKVDVDLQVHQRQALAWLEANGGRGVISLDTGMGKTLTAIAAMQKMVRDGEAKDGQKFLFVCPPSLRGNLAKEIHRFLDKDAAHALLSRVDVMSYGEFRSRAGKMDASSYASVFFDEAQALKNPSNKTTQAALAFNHPRKVCLTASPMEKNPMEAYVLSAVANNVNLADRVEGKEHRREMRKWKERFCETFGGRVVGIVQDELTRSDLHTWVKRNVFFADKRDTASFDLPPLEERSEVIPMPPALEAAYREASRDLEKALRGMVTLFRDKGLLKDGKADPDARDPKIAAALGLSLRPLMQKLDALQNVPERVVPGMGSPKIDRAVEVVKNRLRETDGDARAVLFSDDKEMVLLNARTMSERIPGKIHAACLGDEIRLFQNGVELKEHAGHALPFKPKPYRLDMNAPSDPVHNRHHRKNQWQQFVLGELLGPNRDVTTCSMLGQVYQTGQNLQAFDTCVHLDRDSWNAEDMRQRTARLWRQGQEQTVVELTIDMVYDAPIDAKDATLDQIRAHHQTLEGGLFDDVIRAAQRKELAVEWNEMQMKGTNEVRMDRQVLDLLTSPFVQRGLLSGSDGDG